MTNLRQLSVGDSVWEFSVDSNSWCTVTLVSGEGRVELGADSWDVVRARLSKLTKPCTETKPEWIMSLFERHHALYRQKTSSGVILFWQNAEGKDIWRTVLLEPIAEEQLRVIH